MHKPGEPRWKWNYSEEASWYDNVVSVTTS
jgi:hypothetical protein